MLAIVMSLLEAIVEQVSPDTTIYAAHEPSGFWVGTGSPPAEQQTFWPMARVEQSVGLGLYVVKAAGVIPHRVARDAQLSPDTTEMVRHEARVHIRDIDVS
jgi:hypothetical protein